MGAVLACAACGVGDEGQLPPNVSDPTSVQTPGGAVAFYRGALVWLASVLDDQVLLVGLMTDELTATPSPPGLSVDGSPAFDSRSILRGPYDSTHKLRAQAREARGFLRAYAPDSSPALRGHLYAVEGYAEIFLADLYCSGIPLSRVDFQGNYTLAAGSTTTEVYRHAIRLFDSAQVLFDSAQAQGSDSVRLRHLGAIGRARALLAIGQYDSAAAAVTTVPIDYTYQVVYGGSTRWLQQVWNGRATANNGRPRMANQEGVNGLNYLSSLDPRTATAVVNANQNKFAPAKYFPFTSPTRYVLASGVEARLIEAEAALQVGDSVAWLGKLNQLRQTAWTTIVPAPPGPFDNLADPGRDGAGTNRPREDLLFRERAFWLHVTAQRQGDMRRLVRQYNRHPNTVYPIGPYEGALGAYLDQYVVPVPEAERAFNQMYTGCFDRDP